MEKDRDQHKDIMEKMPIAFAQHKVIYDENEKPVDYIFLDVNKKFEEIAGLSREDLIDKRASEVLDDITDNSLDWIEFFAEISLTGESKTFEEYIETLNSWFEVKVYSQKKGYFTTILNDITEKKKIKVKLKKSQSIAKLGSWELNINEDKLLSWSERVYQLFGIKPSEFDGTYEAYLELVHPEDRDKVDKAYKNIISKENDVYELDHRIIRQDNGEVRFVKVKCEHLRDKKGEVVRTLGIVQDITKRKKQEKKIREKNKKIKKIHDTALDLAETKSEKKACNKTVETAKNILNFELCYISLGEDDFFVPKATTSKTEVKKRPTNIGLVGKTYREGKSFIVDNAQKNTDVVPTKVSYKSGISVPLGDYGVFQAISEKKGAFSEEDLELAELLVAQATKSLTNIYSKEKLKFQSYHDSLTGLYNRRFFEKKLRELDSQTNLPLSIIMLDINGLKIINDSLGYKKGDELIVKTAKILKQTLRDDDILARLGGDDFILLLSQTSNKKARDILKSIQENCEKTEDDELTVYLGGGISTKKEIKQNIEEILSEAIDNMLKNKLVSSKSKMNEIVNSILNSLGAKSDETQVHAKRLSKSAQELGKRLELSNSELDRLSLLSSLHDIGKTSIPKNILNKKVSLSAKEWEMMKKHPEKGYQIASATEEFTLVAEEILSHHENWDGSGYPRGLDGENIPILARIISIIDAYDVMTHERPYSEAISKEEALAEIEKCAGSQFDPELAREL